MLRVKTRLRYSDVHGFGLFADQFIPKDTVVWEFDPGFDPVFPADLVRKRAAEDPVFAAYVAKHAYEEKRNPGFLTFNMDDARFVNDSPTPSLYVDRDGLRSIAVRDLQEGDELTNRYEDFLLDNDVGIAIRWRERES